MSKIGVYWSVMHRRANDYDFFRRLQPSVFKIMDGGPPDYQWVRDNLPNSLIVARDWALSEQHSDMLRDPIGTGKRHAQEWNSHASRLGIDRARTLVLGINEPRVWEAGVPEALRLYTIALCDEGTRLRLRVGAMQLGVGWPGNNGPDMLPDWTPWRGVENAIQRNNGALITHEYWADSGPMENWGWWAGRTLKCPWQVPIVIGEAGIDLFVKSPHFEGNRGWLGHMTPERYAQELAEYVGRMSVDSRFVGACVFAADFASHEWFSFDIEPAYQAILATPIPVYPPVVTPPSVPVMYVHATAGANLRNRPIDGDILVAVPYGHAVQVHGADGSWSNVTYESYTGWILTLLLSHEAPGPIVVDPPVVTPPSSNADWERCIAWILKWEGGYVNDPRDPGGETNFGISKRSYPHLDIRNLTREQAVQIYRTDYWRRSGADQLSWPMSLAHFNIAVNAGVDRAREFLAISNGNFLLYMSIAIEWYTRIDGWPVFGKAWTVRNSDLLKEATK